jgi:integrase
VDRVPISGRLERRVRRDFPERGSAPEILRILDALPDTAGYDAEMFGSERLQAAIVLLAEGSIRQFREAIELALADWRDLLVAAELAQADWPDRLDVELGLDHPGGPGQVTA